ncbi:MAG: hypothetical protein HQM06_18050 [Magnetococcales bacterium]|nr:hypothetical protein [Magnetococcales bacterium]
MLRQQQLSIIAGDTTTYKLTLKSAGAPVDLSRQVLIMTIKVQAEDEDEQALVRKRVTVADDANARSGVGYIVLQSTDTNTLSPGNYVYDIKKVIPGSPPDVATVLWGTISISRSVTRSV